MYHRSPLCRRIPVANRTSENGSAQKLTKKNIFWAKIRTNGFTCSKESSPQIRFRSSRLLKRAEVRIEGRTEEHDLNEFIYPHICKKAYLTVSLKLPII